MGHDFIGFHSKISNPFSATRRLNLHQNKFKVEGFCINISYLAWFFIFFMVLWKSSMSFLKKKKVSILLSCIKTKVAMKFLKKTFFFRPKISFELKRFIGHTTYLFPLWKKKSFLLTLSRPLDVPVRRTQLRWKAPIDVPVCRTKNLCPKYCCTFLVIWYISSFFYGSR